MRRPCPLRAYARRLLLRVALGRGAATQHDGIAGAREPFHYAKANASAAARDERRQRRPMGAWVDHALVSALRRYSGLARNTAVSSPVFALYLSVKPQLVIFVHYLLLIFQQPIDRGFVRHRLSDRLGHPFAMNVEQDLMIEIVVLDHGRRQPDRADDPKGIGFLFRNVTGANGVEHTIRDGELHRPIRMLV